MLTPVSLRGDAICLVPLTIQHVGPLAKAAAVDRSTYGFTWVPDGEDQARAYVERALADEARGVSQPFAVVLRAGDRVVGSTRYMDIDYWDTDPLGGVAVRPPDAKPRALEIGATWYAGDVQRTAVNTEAKWLLLTHAFDDWGVERVTFKTDARNERSRAAILRIGASFEGLRRAHHLGVDGAIRDSAYYSIVRSKWPDVRARLAERLRISSSQ